MFTMIPKVGILLVWDQNFFKIKNKTIFQISSSSWFQKCKKIEKSLFFEDILPSKPLNFFVQKSWLDMHTIVHKFHKNSLFRFKNSYCQSSNFETKKSLLGVIRFWNDHICTFKLSSKKLDFGAEKVYSNSLIWLSTFMYIVKLPLWPSKTNALHFQNSKSCLICWLPCNQLPKFRFWINSEI